jgi:hypothetical protein
LTVHIGQQERMVGFSVARNVFVVFVEEQAA